ncbi:MAG: hypothetical protein J0M04_15995 [Verrucomicrobia bacterium]|nr:hypothetical protein [Verrucomicrobiota bacterium]
MASKQQGGTGTQGRKQPRKAAKSAVKTGANASRAPVDDGGNSDLPSTEFVPSVPPIPEPQREEWLRTIQRQTLTCEDLLIDSRGRTKSAALSYPDENLCDQEAIANYLDLPNAMDVARLAASLLSTRPEGVKQAIALSLEILLRSREMLESGRYELARTMDARSIDVLLSRLVPDKGQLRTERGRLKADPVVGPALAWKDQLERIASSQDDPESVFDCDNPRSSIEKAIILAGRPVPSLPCSLDVALICVADIPSCFASEHLKNIFITFLGLSPMLTPKQRVNLAEADQLVLSITTSSIQPRDDLFGRRYTAILAEVNYRLNFRPPPESGNSEVPNGVKKRAERDFETYWAGEKPVSSPKRLAWIAEHFPPFWERHGAEYTRIREAQACNERERAQRMSDGVQIREKPKWDRRVRHFAKCLQRQGNADGLLTQSDINAAISQFRMEAGKIKDLFLADERTMEKTLNFLRALATEGIAGTGDDVGVRVLRHLDEVSSSSSSRSFGLLKKSGKITGRKEPVEEQRRRSPAVRDKTVNEETVAGCIEILRAAMGSRLPSPSSPTRASRRRGGAPKA